MRSDSFQRPFRIHFFKGLDHRTLPENSFQQIISSLKEDPVQNSVLFYNPNDTNSQLNRWRKVLPWIQPFYAIKSNPISPLLNTLAEHGSSFDCASKSEIEQVLNLGVAPSKIVFSNPIKNEKDIEWAQS